MWGLIWNIVLDYCHRSWKTELSELRAYKMVEETEPRRGIPKRHIYFLSFPVKYNWKVQNELNSILYALLDCKQLLLWALLCWVIATTVQTYWYLKRTLCSLGTCASPGTTAQFFFPDYKLLFNCILMMGASGYCNPVRIFSRNSWFLPFRKILQYL